MAKDPRENWHPSRLIYITKTGSAKLQEAPDIPRSISYLTLSHCWGKVSEKIVLTTKNINEFKKQIPNLKRLRTFEDAVTITKRLGYNWLWIDSLCIMQDSKEDWIREAALMSNVYKYSECTLVAASAVSDAEGCLFTRDVSLDLPSRITVPIPLEDDSFGNMNQTMAKSKILSQMQFDLHWLEKWDADITMAPFHNRAWIVQEVS
jgi:hypothetical protein